MVRLGLEFCSGREKSTLAKLTFRGSPRPPTTTSVRLSVSIRLRPFATSGVMDTPATELAAVVTDQQTNTVSQSSQLTSKADDEQELPMGLETSGAPSMEHKPANKKPKSSGKSGEGRECRCALLRRLEADISQSEEASPWSATESAANSGTAEEDHTPSSRAETSQKGAGGDGMVREAFQAATLFEKLPFELICEVSHVMQRQTSRWILPNCPRGLQVFSYLDLSDLIHVMRVLAVLERAAPGAKRSDDLGKVEAQRRLRPLSGHVRGQLCSCDGRHSLPGEFSTSPFAALPSET